MKAIFAQFEYPHDPGGYVIIGSLWQDQLLNLEFLRNSGPEYYTDWVAEGVMGVWLPSLRVICGSGE